jgi:SAM-dependent methyltransferase
MNFLELKDISERYMELLNPISATKIVTIGRFAGLESGHKVIDFGCGFGEVLALWVEYFGISGVGIDVREYACRRASQKMSREGYEDRIKIVCTSGEAYQFEPRSYDLAACIGASFIWGGFRPTIHALREAIHPDGKLVIGEPYWTKQVVPPEYAQREQDVHTECELLQITRQEGFDIEYMVRANQDEWDNYEASNWYGLIHWIEENPDHPERQQVIDHLHESQEEYFQYGREYLGWAIFVLNPIKYR